MSFALVFPGQGIQGPELLAGLPDSAFQSSDWQWVLALLEDDPRAMGEASYFKRNEVASLLTVFHACSALDQLELKEKPQAMAGYSVGMIMALMAAGTLTREQLFKTVHERAMAMNDCCHASEPHGMTAVIGIPSHAIEQILQDHDLGQVVISNRNAPGQFTLGGPVQALEKAEHYLKERRPRKIQRLETQGAWHSPQMANAALPVQTIFLDVFKNVSTSVDHPIQPTIVDNVTGHWLDTQNLNLIAETMGRQVWQPVQWEQGLRTMIDSGIDTFVEVGCGTTLSKFGFFIDRRCKHLHWSQC